MYTLFFFLLALGILVAFHEFGHFWVARRLGVKVLRFSIGFGPVLWSRRQDPDGTEFTLSAIPLGGYVRMADEREGEVESKDLPYAFNRQSLPVRSAIVAAGPLFNFALAILLYWLVLSVGETGLRPLLGSVAPGSLAAEAGFVAGDEITAVDGRAAPIWEIALGSIFRAVVEKEEIPIDVRTEAGEEVQRLLVIPPKIAAHPEQLMTRLGFRPASPRVPPVIDKVLPGSAAEQAGLRHGDLLLDADGEAIGDWQSWVDYVRARPGRDIRLQLERDGMRQELTIRPEEVQEAGKGSGRIGATVFVPEDLMHELRAEYRLGPFAALGESLRRVWDYSGLTLKMMGRMFIGQASVDNLSGPIGIAQYAGQSARLGWSHFFKFLAVVSLSLGVLNLLPIPVLDGGYLFFYLVEAVKGSPLSEETMALAQRIGMGALILLMSLAFALDIQRLFS
ncbi:MAG TPA: RIP metalloprotease RseP [Methylococcaceae bacterium]|nr:RIP metalloprotease RseP [Methylococcaceae bacterium]